jgi:RHS repeat-associated protein
LDKPTNGTLTVSGSGGRTNRKGQVNVNLDGRPAGWQTVPVAGILPTTTGALRVRVWGDKESAAKVSEARIIWFPSPASQAGITISYPLHGECQDHKTYLRGFASGSGGLQRPQLSVDGQPMVGKIDADGSFEADVQEPGAVKGKPWSIRLDVATEDGGHRTRTVAIDTCVDKPKGRIIGVSPPVEDVGAPYGAVVSPQKASALSFAGATIDIPAGAVDSDVRVTMRALENSQVPPVQTEMDNVTTSGRALRFGPHGFKFKKPIKVTLPFDGARLPAGMTPADVVPFFFNEASRKWTELPRVASRPDSIVAETTHFTDFIASTVHMPEHPDAQQFNSNTMTGLKAGDPGAGIALIQPPAANSDGSARLSYPIETPPGRNGIEPHLALTYDSDRVNANGWLGLGWNLGMSYIEIDTRFGVPKYDGTELYTLDGSMLTQVGAAGTYIRRIEGSFDLIQRMGPGDVVGGGDPTTYYWKVTDKRGTVYTYGTSSTTFNSRLANPRSGQLDPLTGQPVFGRIFRWYLESVQDTYGNLMTIKYHHDASTLGTAPSTENGDEVYLSEIDYTSNSFTSLAAAYRVTFALDAVGTRPDSTMSARAGFVVATRQRLTDIKVWMGPSLVRQYHFDYQPNLTDTLQKSVLADVALWGNEDDNTSELYRHTFEYNKAPDPNASAMFSEQQTWGQVWQPVPPPGGGYEIKTDNGLAHSNDNLIGGSITLGAGFPFLSVSGSFGMDYGSSTPDLAFLGITGDGLPDQIDTNGMLSQNILQLAPGSHFSPAHETGVTMLGNTGRSGFTAGGNVSALQGLFGAGASYSRHVSNESGLMSDINGDGFPDIVIDGGSGVVAYLNDGRGDLSTTPQQWTGYSLANSPFSTANRLTDPTVAGSNFYTDPLIRWVAPFDGTVTINSQVEQGLDPVRAELYVGTDPVRSLQTQPGLQTVVSNYSRSVQAGDKIYMRVVSQAADDPNRDMTEFSTSVDYTPPPGRSASEVGPTGASIFSYDSDTSVWMTGQPRLPWHLTANGDVGVARCFQGAYLDDLTVSYILRNSTGGLVNRFDLTIPAGGSACFPSSTLPISPSDQAMGMISCVAQDETLDLEYSSDSPLGISNYPYWWGYASPAPANGHLMSYTSYCRLSACGSSQCGAPQDTGSGYAIPGDPYSSEFPVPATDVARDWPPPFTEMHIWRTFHPQANGTQPILSVPAASSSVTFGGSVTTNGALTEDVVVLIQGVQKLHKKVKIPAGTPANTTFPLNAGPIAVTSGEPVFFTVYSPTLVGGNVTFSPTMNGTAIASGNINDSIRDATFDNNPPTGDNSRDPMSGGFQNWFFGDWNDSIQFCDNVAGCANPIVRTTAAPQNNDVVMGDVPLVPGQAGGQFWAGRGGSQIFSLGGAPIMLGGQVYPPSATATDASSMAGLRVSDTWNVNVTAGAGIISGGVNGGDSTGQVDFLDFNGDHFPDSITFGGVQYNDGVQSFSPRYGVDMKTEEGTSNEANEIRRILNASVQAGITVGDSNSRQLINEAKGRGETKKVSATEAVSGSADYGVSSTRIDFVDVNGDGLPDHVRQEPNDSALRVRLNLGYGFSNEIQWSTSAWSVANVSPTTGWLNIGEVASDALNNFVPGTPASTNVVRMQDTGTSGLSVGVQYGDIGGGGGPSYSVTRNWVDLMDVNGDGLPDQVMKVPGDATLHVKLNMGDHFGTEQAWSLPAWQASTGINFSFLTPDGLEFSTIDGWAKNLSAQFCWIVCFGLSGFESDSKGGPSAQFEDIDGDGDLDQVMKVPGDENVYAKLNNVVNDSGPPNLLVAVDRPLGGRFEITYARSGNYVDLTSSPMVNMPSNQWAMSSVVLNSNTQQSCPTPNGPSQNCTTQNFVYTNPSFIPSGYYDPVERENFGYANVKTMFPYEDTGTSIASQYNNQNYYLHGLETSTSWYQDDANQILQRVVTNTFWDQSGKDATQQPALTGSYFPSNGQTDTYVYELSSNATHTFVSRLFDASGNLTDYIDNGDAQNPFDGSQQFNYHVDYQQWGTNITVPSGIAIRQGAGIASGTLLAERTATFIGQPKPQTVTDVIVNGKDPTSGTVRTEAQPGDATWTYTYDTYGNVQTAASPSGTRVLTYTYDGNTETYPVTTTQSDPGSSPDPNATYTSTANYDFRFGLPTQVVDVAGAQQQIDYDNYGRITKAFAPSDFDAGGNRINTNAPTIGVIYSEYPHINIVGAETLPAWAKATHMSNVPDEGSLPGDPLSARSLNTVNFIDGLERSIQIKKDITHDDGTGRTTDGMSVSGQTIFDSRGRIYQQGQPTFVPGATGNTSFVAGGMANATQYAYDVLGRLRQEQHPDNGVQAITNVSYQLANSPTDGEMYDMKMTTDPLYGQDPNYHYRQEYLDVHGQVGLLVEANLLNGAPTTLYTAYNYDQLGHMIAAIDAQGNTTTASYDTVGHLVTLTSPDAGSHEWRYCVAGYLCAEQTANMLNADLGPNFMIQYAYDRDRLKTITYPSHATDPVGVTYTYGTASQKGNATSGTGYMANRVTQRTDEAGTFNYDYDGLGNVASETAQLPSQIAGQSYPSYQTQYKWDNFSRLIDVTIPGTIRSRPIVNTPGETIRYGYDDGGAVTSARGKLTVSPNTTFDYVTHVGYDEFGARVRIAYGNQDFSTYGYYSDTRRLESANTTVKDSTGMQRPTQALVYSYDLLGNLTSRVQSLPQDTVSTDAVPVGGYSSQTFSYDPLNQMTHADMYDYLAITEDDYGQVDVAYDALGNIVDKNQNDGGDIYDSSGNWLGSFSGSQLLYELVPHYLGTPQNPSSQHAATSVDEYHYSDLSTRALTYDYDGNVTSSTYNGSGRFLTWTDTDRLRSTCNGPSSTNCPPLTNTLYAADGRRVNNMVTSGGFSTETVYVNQYLTVRNGVYVTKHVFLGDAIVASKMDAGNSTYWYHSDNVQSTQYMTASDGTLAQHLSYYPGGEIWREQDGVSTPISHETTFTGKELDDATGYYYFGARYYEPTLQAWLSPDPMLKRYVEDVSAATLYNPRNLQLYTYAWNNPVGLRDPTGGCVEDLCIAEGAIAVGAFLSSPTGQRTIATAGAALTAGTMIATGVADRAWNGIRNLFSESKSPGAVPVVPAAPTGNRSKAGTSPVIDPASVVGKTPDEIAKVAADHGLIAKGKNPQAGQGAYIDPVTGEQRILIHPTPSSGDPHAHVNDAQGNRLDVNGKQVPDESPQAHLPIKTK